MKKHVISFFAFVLVFLCSLGFIYFEANPTLRLNNTQEQIEWHGQAENEFGTYDGTLIGDLFSGEGSFRFLSGETYVGNWKDSYMSGSGTVSFPRVGVYSGEMRDSMRSGHGVFTWNTGESYDGDWEDDKMSGPGTYTFANGTTLTGIFQNNKPVSGSLAFYDEATDDDPDTKIVSLVYSFSDTERHIAFSTKGGLKYDGDISGLIGAGTAAITYPGGNSYEGQLLNGQRHGSGKYVWRDNAGSTVSYYEGNWDADHMHGTGKYHFTRSEYPYLSGSFENDVPSGTLVYYKALGNTFETKWEHGSCVSIKET